jgi:hypothetical protein
LKGLKELFTLDHRGDITDTSILFQEVNKNENKNNKKKQNGEKETENDSGNDNNGTHFEF